MYKVQTVTVSGRAVKGQIFREVPADQVDTARATLRREFPRGSTRHIRVTQER